MRLGFGITILMFVLAVWPGASAIGQDDEAVAHFERRVRPLLIERCLRCHGPEKQRGGLRLDKGEEFRKGADTGPVVVDSDPEQSPLIAAVRYSGDIQMPPDGKLSDQQIADLEQWVRAGAAWPDSPPAAPSEPADHAPTAEEFSAAERAFWAFQPPTRPATPAVENRAWPNSPIDRFILARLEAAGLSPATDAARHHLIRRATLDLTGLLPTPEEVREFLADSAPDALARLVDRLLASPAYGERWGRIWLDVARYADSNGLDENMAYEHAWQYRDYVIRAFNEDKPFDQFVCEQLAGDLLTAADADGAVPVDAVTATGFLALGPKSLREVDAKKMEMDIIDEQVTTVGEAFLGLTLGCARCHDHKFDPIRQEDYYALAGIFSSTRTMKTHGSKEGVGDGEWLQRELPGDPPITVMAVTEGTIHDLPVHLRGSHLTLAAETVPRGFPGILDAVPAPAIPRDQSGRLQLAQWLIDPRHPLTSRVIANRIWQGHFGHGLVRSANNFGELGERPDHPELLDWLATTLIRDGWSLKTLHRRMLLSRTWQLSAVEDSRSRSIDPANRLLSHMSRRRMDAETLRDSILAVSDRLDCQLGGTLSPLKNRQYVTDSKSSAQLVTYDFSRRSMYLPVIRNVVYDLLKTFDFPDPSVPSGGRAATVVAPQALLMMNSEFVLKHSDALAERALCRDDLDDAGRLQWLYELLFSRPASSEEAAVGLAYLRRFENAARSEPGAAADADCRRTAWQTLSQVLLATNEFLYIE